MKSVRAALEENDDYPNAVAVTLYFTDDPSREEVVAACKEANLVLSVDVTDPFFTFKFRPNEVSLAAGLCRVQCHPTG